MMVLFSQENVSHIRFTVILVFDFASESVTTMSKHYSFEQILKILYTIRVSKTI